MEKTCFGRAGVKGPAAQIGITRAWVRLAVMDTERSKKNQNMLWRLTGMSWMWWRGGIKYEAWHPDSSVNNCLGGISLFSPPFYMWSEVKLLSCVRLCDPMDCSLPGSGSMGFSRQEYWSGLPFSSPGDLPNSGIEPESPVLQTGALPSEPLGKNYSICIVTYIYLSILYLWSIYIYLCNICIL